LNDYHCDPCDWLVDHCKTCQLEKNPGNVPKKKLGWDDELSVPFSKNMTLAKLKPEWVTCKDPQ